MPMPVDAMPAHEVGDALRGCRFGVTTVLDVVTSSGVGADGDEALIVQLTLSDPNGDTWPRRDVAQIFRAVLDALDKTQLEVPVSLRLAPESADPRADDDQLPLFG